MATFALLALTGLSCVKYGISLRYAAFCDIPLIWLACTQVLFLSKRFSTARAAIFAASMLATLCTIGLNQYMRIFVRGGLYDPITSQLVMKLDMYKSNEAVRAELATRKQRYAGSGLRSLNFFLQSDEFRMAPVKLNGACDLSPGIRNFA